MKYMSTQDKNNLTFIFCSRCVPLEHVARYLHVRLDKSHGLCSSALWGVPKIAV